MDSLPIVAPKFPPALPAIRAIPRIGPIDLYAALLADSRCENTRSAREYDARMFGRFLRCSEAEACALLISGGRANANAIGLAFRQHEQDRGQAPGTVNRRLATLRRVVVLSRRFELVEWAVDIDDLKAETYRDTRGPGVEGWRAIWKVAVEAGDWPQARRNRCLLRLLHDNGLRRSEVVGIDYPEDVDIAGQRVAIKGKGRGSKAFVTTSPRCAALMSEWLLSRGRRPGPFFVSHVRVDDAAREELIDRAVKLGSEGKTSREIAELFNAEGMLTPTGLPWTRKRLTSRVGQELAPMHRLRERDVNFIVNSLGERAGIDRRVKPHGIRHYSISRVLDLTDGNVRAAQKYARHANPITTLKYDDNRTDLAGDMTRLLGEDD